MHGALCMAIIGTKSILILRQPCQ